MQSVNYDLARCLIISNLRLLSRAEAQACEQNVLLEKLMKGKATPDEQERFATLLTTDKYGFLECLPNLGVLEEDGVKLFNSTDKSANETLGYAADACVQCLIGEKKKAFDLLIDAEEKGEHVNRSLGDMYYYGIGVNKNIEEAKKCYATAKGYREPKHSVASILSDYYYNIGMAHCTGQGVEKNIDKAFLNFYRSFKYGNIASICMMIRILYNTNLEKATNYCRMAIAQIEKDMDVKQRFDKNLAGWLYVTYANLIMDPRVKSTKNDSAIDYLKKAAKLGNATALYNLGAMYECGYETDSSLKVALDYYKEATQEGHPNALAAKYEVKDKIYKK